MKWEYRKLKETYVDVFPFEITLVNYSYNVTNHGVMLLMRLLSYNTVMTIRTPRCIGVGMPSTLTPLVLACRPV